MAKQYAKACRDCGQQIHMLEQTNGQWRAYDDAEHQRPHECRKKPMGQSPSSGQASTPQQKIGDSSPTNSAQPGFTALQEEVIRRIVADELRKRLGGLLD